MRSGLRSRKPATLPYCSQAAAMRSTAARKSGCSNCPRMPSESVRSKCPAPGNAGQTITQSVPSASASASATGPILPSGVESKVEHYLKTNCWHPCFCNHFSAASDCATASEAGTERDFSATTPASTEAAHQDQKCRYIAPCAYPVWQACSRAR